MPPRAKSPANTRPKTPTAGMTSSVAAPIRALRPATARPVSAPSGQSHGRTQDNLLHLIHAFFGPDSRPISSHKRPPQPTRQSHQPSPYPPYPPAKELHPADRLSTYLRLANIEDFSSWPTIVPNSKRQWAASLVPGLGGMGVEWTKRFKAAEMGRADGRALRSWDTGRDWSTGILEHLERHISDTPVEDSRRVRSESKFALHAAGFSASQCSDPIGPDQGLLNWLRGNVLETAVCALHMVRNSAHRFKFSTVSPVWRKPGDQDAGPPSTLWEGFGALVLHNTRNDHDRAMVVLARPPSVISGAMLGEFARSGSPDGWSHWPAERATTEAGQVNLLQAQVYDDCRHSRVYFFAVTTAEYWVFGQFNKAYTRCTVSPVITLSSREPNVIQCLTSWVVRSYDYRLCATDKRASQHRVAP
ncbi:hypothetical protein Q8F55_000506 [Vanrija albida]|uniref:Uncharacterized protein n=1 Tax=Vanrija albida TaxID=181172 RepID=A0ABR3QDH8_9TREE